MAAMEVAVDSFETGYRRILERVGSWASGQPRVRAVIVIGSRARTDHPADAWADLDLMLFAEDADGLAADRRWVDDLATVWLTFVTRTPDGAAWERRTLFAGGLDVDMAILPASALDGFGPASVNPGAEAVLRRGVTVLYDPGGRLRDVASSPRQAAPAPGRPDPADFDRVVEEFWYHTVWSAKHLLRGELWWAKAGSDGLLKDRLLTMLRWHAMADSATTRDTWTGSRFLEEWADPRARAAFPSIYAHYDRQDIAATLLATMELFRWVSAETADRFGLSLPEPGIEATTRLVGELLATA